jgi:hypothetical protein
LYTTIIICNPHQHDWKAVQMQLPLRAFHARLARAMKGVFVCQMSVSPFRNERTALRAVLSRLRARPYGLSAPLEFRFFRFVDT